MPEKGLRWGPQEGRGMSDHGEMGIVFSSVPPTPYQMCTDFCLVSKNNKPLAFLVVQKELFPVFLTKPENKARGGGGRFISSLEKRFEKSRKLGAVN